MIDAHRLARAIHLDVERVDGDRYQVFGGEAMHAVDLAAAAGQECDCNDQRFRGGNCKHVLAAQLSVLGPGILAGLRELLPWAAGREKAM